MSDIPFDGPVGAVRVADVDGELVVNPTYEQRDAAGLEIVVAGTDSGITMVEGGAEEASEERMVEAIALAHDRIRELCALQMELVEACGRAKLPLPPAEPPLSVHDELWAWALPKMQEACFVKGKFERSSAIKEVCGAALAEFADRIGDDEQERAHTLLEDLETHVVRESILANQVRTDGRGPDDIRPISCEIDVLPRAHGAALFNPRRDAGAGPDHPGQRERRTACPGRVGDRSRHPQGLHAALQTSRPSRSAKPAAWARVAGRLAMATSRSGRWRG